MIRADSTLADARYRSVFPQGKQTDSPANWKTFEEGISGRLGRSDPRTPGVKFEPGLAGTPHDAGRTRLGPSQYIGFQERRDSSTTVSSNSLLFPQHSSRRRVKGAIPP